MTTSAWGKFHRAKKSRRSNGTKEKRLEATWWMLLCNFMMSCIIHRCRWRPGDICIEIPFVSPAETRYSLFSLDGDGRSFCHVNFRSQFLFKARSSGRMDEKGFQWSSWEGSIIPAQNPRLADEKNSARRFLLSLCCPINFVSSSKTDFLSKVSIKTCARSADGNFIVGQVSCRNSSA